MDEWTRERILRIVAFVLVLAVALAIVGQIIYVLSIPGGRFTDRLELISQIAAGPTLAALVLAAALLPLVDAEVETDDVEADDVETEDVEAGEVGASEVVGATNWVSMAAAALGGVMLAAALFSIIHTFTLHIPSPNETGASLQVGVATNEWATRIGQILLRLAGGVIGACAAWVGIKTSGIRGPTTPLVEA